MAMLKKGSILTTANCSTRSCRETLDLWGPSVKPMALPTLSLTSGTSYGPVAPARLTYTRVWMSIRELTTFHIPTKSPGKIGFALITWRCKRSLGGRIMTFSLILTSCQTSTGTSWITTRSWSSPTLGETSGLSSPATLVKVKESTLSMTSTTSTLTSYQLYLGTSRTLSWSTGTSSIWESTLSSPATSHSESTSTKKD